MKSSTPRTKVSRNIAHITLVLFLMILLAQSAIGLFFPLDPSLNSIDIVLRSTISSIFGYLMSSVGRQSLSSKKESVPPRTIGFTPPKGITSMAEGEDKVAPPTPPIADTTVTALPNNPQAQTIIIAILGLFSLTILISLRYFGSDYSDSPGAIATVAQYRDVISGSIGALIGQARGQSN